MPDLYPEIKPYVNHSLKVEPPHILHIEEYGNVSGIPVVVVHGGPGAGSEPYQRRFFDPDIYRIIIFDQRGCGQSVPHAELQGNNTQALVDDLERIREHLAIERWVVFGGSWGSTLGLVYAETYPERVLGLILRGIFLCRPTEIDWFYQEGGASRIFPDYWQDYIRVIPVSERGDLLQAYYRRLTGDDELARMAAAKSWSKWEARAASLQLNSKIMGRFTAPYTALSLARIECHYFVNNAFLEPDQILKSARYLKNIPGYIIHGRYDIICPIENAYLLHRAWSEAEFQIISNAGHSATEVGIRSALITATRALGQRLS